jgi:hypothetical protein
MDPSSGGPADSLRARSRAASPGRRGVGQSTYEEIDETSTAEGGVNFGWPTTEGPTSDSRFRTPFHYYAHASGQCAITGGAFYDPATLNFSTRGAGRPHARAPAGVPGAARGVGDRA